MKNTTVLSVSWLVAILSGCSASDDGDTIQSKNSSLIGGERVDATVHPEMIWLRRANDQYCSGIMVSGGIVTAAHCVDGLTATNTLYMTNGPTRDDDYAHPVGVMGVYVHPAYPAEQWADVAFITLYSDGVSLPPSYVLPVSPPATPSPGTTIEVMGYGCQVAAFTSFSAGVRKRGFGVVESVTDTYFTSARDVTHDLTTGAPSNDPGVCQGDSGGPVFVNGALVALSRYVWWDHDRRAYRSGFARLDRVWSWLRDLGLTGEFARVTTDL